MIDRTVLNCNIRLIRWCLLRGLFIGKVIRHRGLGSLTVDEIAGQYIKVSSLDRKNTCNLSLDYFYEEFTRLFSFDDIRNWRSQMELERVAEEKKAIEKAEREQALIEQKRLEEIARLEIKQKKLLKIKDFIQLNIDALSDPISRQVNLASPTLTSEDFQLINLWIKDGSSNYESEKSRMISARLAEIALCEFYRSHGKEVEDVSVTQIDNSAGDDWKKYDLNVGGKFVDVKNSRRSQVNLSRYTSHCVAKFKEQRPNESVAIAGTLSYWVPPSEAQNSNKSILFLGTTTKRKYEALQSEFSTGYLRVDFRLNSTLLKSFLPPWIFNYPQKLYESRNKSFVQLQKIQYPDYQDCEEANLNPLPIYIASGLPYTYKSSGPMTRLETEFVASLYTRVNKMGLSLSVIFLSILDNFLCALRNPSNEPYSPCEYRKLIFPMTDMTRPLFVYDPLLTIDSLINCLSVLWLEKTAKIEDFSIFQLQGFNVLRGKKNIDDSYWTTLLAYCGGWVETETGVKPCGNIPLVYGESKSCNVCGKLICPKCGFCSNNCQISA